MPEARILQSNRPGVFQTLQDLSPARQTIITSTAEIGLYDPKKFHDACGVAGLARTDGIPTNELIAQALTSLANMEHRGASGYDPLTSDGAGILLQIPHQFLAGQIPHLPAQGQYGVANFLMPRDGYDRMQHMVDGIIKSEGLHIIAWREVPCDDSVIGPEAKKGQPVFMQAIISRPPGLGDQEFEKLLYFCRKRFRQEALKHHEPGTGDALYCSSCSSQSIVYKGLSLPSKLGDYFLDLQDPRMASALAIVHSRFATNALPTWMLAHPYSMLAHNGEINTVSGNRLSWRALQDIYGKTLFGDRAHLAKNFVSQHGSDSRSLDGALQMLVHGGLTIEHGLRALIPEAFEGGRELPPEVLAFYRYHAALSSPWDGPASILASDGKSLVATSDRNGLRPQRIVETKSGLLIIGSEDGIIPIDPKDLIKRSAGTAGSMVSFSPEKGFRNSAEIIEDIFQRDGALYTKAVSRRVFMAPKIEAETAPRLDADRRDFLKRAFGYTEEDERILITPLAMEASQPMGSMGDDTPLAVLSAQARPLFDYFKQLFAQVTNPPIDPIREKLATSLTTFLGPMGNILEKTVENGDRIEISSPIINDAELREIKKAQAQNAKFATATLDTCFVANVENGLEAALKKLCQQAEDSVKAGSGILVLSDRAVSSELAPIPSLLALSAVHQHLSNLGLRQQTSLIVDSGEPREVHHFACLIGFGADAINPYLLLNSVHELAPTLGMTADQAQANTRKALDAGLLKTMAKMGISPVASYRGAQLFEALGISKQVAEQFFGDVTSRIGGVDLKLIEEDALYHHTEAVRARHSFEPTLEPGGRYQVIRDGESHAITDATAQLVQAAVQLGPDSEFGMKLWLQFKQLVDASPERPRHLRDLLQFNFAETPLDLSEVEDAASIMRRFTSGAMSLGSISTPAHETLAKAMNTIHGKSNSGEGGENVERRTDPERRSKIKQIASGRFGVSAHYLATADEIQIKIAQGAKPGEGGELDGSKVTALIAAVRNTTPGVTLISPPPHHDIYSIEDLKQLIFDLRQINPNAKISVKLVSEVGVGTISAGVAKAGSDKIITSGADGGTGASPLSSVKHAGLPWELGLSEVQQVLLKEKLRPSVISQVDGQLLTGRDVVIAAIMGGDEFGFSTGPLLAMGCDYLRKCHLGTCSVGIATQDEDLIANFQGKPEDVINFLKFVAEEARYYLAKLGKRSFSEIIGRTELLSQILSDNPRLASIDLSALLTKQGGDSLAFESFREQNTDTRISKALKDAVGPWLDGTEAALNVDLGRIRNSDLTIGAQLSGDISRQFGENGLPGGRTLTISAFGEAGQSCGAFLTRGMTLKIEGVVNDYLGKGLSGGEIIVFPPTESDLALAPHLHNIAGNTCFYGAIRGKAFLAGKGGERFAVRNSGADLVVEGTGGNVCEYMTGGVVTILGEVGPNPFAGMSGGIAYAYAPDEKYRDLILKEAKEKGHQVEVISVSEDPVLRNSVIEHLEKTNSPRAQDILSDGELKCFIKILPVKPSKK